jgi:release factor glutamine methyltransferase
MLPTPSTSHVDFERIYEPAEDSYLLLDTLSSEAEKAFLKSRFSTHHSPTSTSTSESSSFSVSPLVLEIGTGSGVILSFLNAHASTIFSRNDILTLGIDVNTFACHATTKTVNIAECEIRDQRQHNTTTDNKTMDLSHGLYLGNILGDLTSPIMHHQIDILVFNPPYVPTPSLPNLPHPSLNLGEGTKTSYEDDSYLLELSYAGGIDGMETTERLLAALPGALSKRGVAHILLCAQNRPENVKERVRSWGPDWRAETVGRSGMKGGW